MKVCLGVHKTVDGIWAADMSISGEYNGICCQHELGFTIVLDDGRILNFDKEGKQIALPSG